MLKKIFLFIITIIGACSTVQAQGSDCETMLRKKLELDDPQRLTISIRKLRGCGIDSIDASYLSNPSTLAPLMVAMTDSVDMSELTYGDLLKMAQTLFQDTGYKHNKELTLRMIKIMDNEATPQNWDEDTRPLLTLAFTQKELDDAKKIMLDNPLQHWSYRTIMYKYTTALQTAKKDSADKAAATHQKGIKEERSKFPASLVSLKETGYHILAFSDYEEGLKYAKTVGKPVLLFFNGMMCINCRKMEQNVLDEPEIKALLQEKFVVIDLMLDDMTPLDRDKRRYSKALSSRIETKGQVNIELQVTTYKHNSQPHLALLDKTGKHIADTYYIDGSGNTTTKDSFIAFLGKVLGN